MDNKDKKSTLSREARNKDHKKKIYKILASSFLIASIPTTYILWWIPYSNQQAYAKVINDVESFVENEYTGALKENVTTKDVITTQKTLENISDEKLKKRAEEEVAPVLEQAKIQTQALDKFNRIQNAKKYSEIKTEDAQSLIQDAQEIKNVTLRSKLLKQSNELIDKYNNTTSVINEVNSLKDGDWSGYYKATANIDTVSYKEVKADLKNKLEDIRKKNEQLDQEKARSDSEKLNNEVKNAESVQYNNSIAKGKSFITEQKDPEPVTPDSIASEYFKSNSTIKTLILINSGNIYLYTSDRNNSLATDTVRTRNLSITETTNIGVGVSSSDSGGSNDIVKVSDAILSANSDANIQVSSGFMSQLVNTLKNQSSEVAFLVKE